MPNKSVFNTHSQSQKADTVNRAGGKAYKLSDKAALAQYAVTGTFNGAYYVGAKTQYQEALKLARSVDTEYLAKIAVYARKHAFMKDMPAFLLAVLATRDTVRFKQVFFQVVDNAKMLRNFVQIMRSGAVGRRSLGSAPKKMIQKWFRNSTDEYLFKASVGNDPSLADVIKMVHPRPHTKQREALYGYLTGNPYNADKLPQLVKDFEKFKRDSKSARTVPNVPFQMLTALDLQFKEWMELARNGNWHFTRMNLNTFARNNVFSNKKITRIIRDRLKSAENVQKARVFPMHLFSAYKNASNGVPPKVRNALSEAMEHSLSNVPAFEGKDIAVFVDCSGSMAAPITGYRRGATTTVTANGAASLFAAAILRKNPDDTKVFKFDTRAREVKANPLDTVMTLTSTIGRRGGATDLGCTVAKLNSLQAKHDLVFVLSDMECWAAPYGHSTALQAEWGTYKRRNPNAQLVCINMVQGGTAQATNRTDVLNVGGFNDQVFRVIDGFVKSSGNPDYWVNAVESVDLGDEEDA